jgi:hypothetical protein
MSEQRDEITRRMTTLSAEMGTTVRHDGDHVWIDARRDTPPIHNSLAGGEAVLSLKPGPTLG